MKKLTYAQEKTLEKLMEGDQYFFELLGVGASGATTKKLVAEGLAVEVSGRSGRKWQITPAGRRALMDGKY